LKLVPETAAVVIIHSSKPGLLGKIFYIQRELRIGRDSGSDAVIDDPELLPHHATIRRFGRTALEIETSSADAKVVVDDRETTFSVLAHQSEITMGGVRLRVLAEGNMDAAYHNEIYRMLIVDSLTGLNNQRYLEEALEREILRARRYDRPLAIAGFRIDGLNQVRSPDAELRALAKVFTDASPKDHIVARVDGFEFAIVMPEVDLTNGKERAARISMEASKAVPGARVTWVTTSLQSEDSNAARILARVRLPHVDVPPSA
jgi:two-component system cell cycle response regulator